MDKVTVDNTDLEGDTEDKSYYVPEVDVAFKHPAYRKRAATNLKDKNPAGVLPLRV